MQKMFLMVLVITLLTAIILPVHAEETMTRPRLVKRVTDSLTPTNDEKHKTKQTKFIK